MSLLFISQLIVALLHTLGSDGANCNNSPTNPPLVYGAKAAQTLCDTLPPTVTRGAYLQLLSDSSITLRWRTDVACNSAVFYGSEHSNLTMAQTDTACSTEHIVSLQNLLPNTKYYYAIGSLTDTLQGDSSYYFVTAPPIGTEKPTRIWATGDCGTGQTVQLMVQAAYQNFTGGKHNDLWLLLGDNAYASGLDSEYQSNFFAPYMQGRMMRKTPLFPTPGNHDYYNNPDLNSLDRAYFQNFSLPTQAEIGGVPSNTEAYYSFDYANIHFISLDSYGTVENLKMYDTTSTQITWLKQDLAANTQKWTIIYWHHPPYTMGSHNSDTEGDLVAIREKVIRILDRYRVDLVLCGHSHCYERSKLMHGHYGMEATFDSLQHLHSQSSGKYDFSANSCPYVKSSDSPVNEGMVYVVAGSSGKLSGGQGSYPHEAMYSSTFAIGGSLCLDIDGNRLDAQFITQYGEVFDRFTIMKEVNQNVDTTICKGASIDLQASWKGQYQWQGNGYDSPQITVNPTVNTIYTVSDGAYNCLSDTIQVNVSPSIIADNMVYRSCTYHYSTPAMPNVTYTWSVVGGIILNGQGTPNVEVIWNVEGVGQISVSAD
jgi:3',5'-cyclic AMP phosphodiesterase CpdA